MSVQSSPPARATQNALINQVRMLAMEIGIRPAARKLGVKEDTACKWAERYNWNISGTKPGPPNSVSNLSASPADVLQRELEADNVPTRTALAKAHRKAAEHAAQLRAEELMKPGTAQALKAHGQGAALTHGWEQKQNAPNVMVNIALLGVDPSEVRVEGTTVDEDQPA